MNYEERSLDAWHAEEAELRASTKKWLARKLKAHRNYCDAKYHIYRARAYSLPFRAAQKCLPIPRDDEVEDKQEEPARALEPVSADGVRRAPAPVVYSRRRTHAAGVRDRLMSELRADVR